MPAKICCVGSSQAPESLRFFAFKYRINGSSISCHPYPRIKRSLTFQKMYCKREENTTPPLQLEVSKGEEVTMTGIPSTPHFILVHGASHGAWCWYKIRCLLENSGNRVTCVDLTGAGIHPTDPNTVFSFDEYNKPLIDLISALSEDEKIILVGHSLGGLSLTQVLHKFGNKIRLAIYVAAAMERSGHSLQQQEKKRRPEDLEQIRKMFELKFFLGPDNPPTSVLIRKEYQRECFYHMSPQEDSTLASMLLRPTPCRATREVHFEEGPATDTVKRVFIKTTCDKIMHPERQDQVINGWPPSRVFTIESDHCPFFSAPTELFNLILKAQKELI